ncbi:hypothetical protein [Ancylomarina salipaludis]|uniref:hypothetical protein n=1 Tax=Ancylomarina salipaludis TaxID=2501299 RepID=UPI0013E902D3|nr:hypothetical protein [Ancylomarina salipaludis]
MEGLQKIWQNQTVENPYIRKLNCVIIKQAIASNTNNEILTDEIGQPLNFLTLEIEQATFISK